MSNRSSSSTFFRLVVTYVGPYRVRLAVGILAGALVGGSVFGVLQSSTGFFRPFDTSSAPSGTVRTGVDSPSGAVPVLEAADSSADSGSAVQSPDAEEIPPWKRDRLDRILGILDRLGVEHVSRDQAMSRGLMLLAAATVLAFVLLRMVAIVLNRYFLRWVGSRVVVDIRNDLFGTLQRQSLAFFAKCDVGQLISRCTYDTARIEGAIASTIADMARAPFEIVAALAFVAHYAGQCNLGSTVLLFAVVLPVSIGPIIILGRFVKRYAKRSFRRISVLVSRMQENFTCVRVVKAYNMEERETERFRELSENYFRAVIRAVGAEVLMTPVMECVAAVCLCLFFVICYFRQIPISQMFPMAIAGFLAYKPFKQLAKINAALQRSAAAAERIFSLLDTDTSLPMAPNPVTVKSFEDRIVFHNVDFSYGEEQSPVLRGVSFEMPKGSVVAFVGETGSGKTTVANLLARFYDPTGGSVLMDGVDLRDMDLGALRRIIGVVTQETILFNDSIANNISYGSPEADMADIIDAAKKANAHDFIIAEPGGYERTVGDKGAQLSGGQRQRIAIARAILKNPPILILDEATSALDTATEQLVQDAINRVMEDRTVFAIAHRLSTIKHADMICLLDNGCILERGTHEQLYGANGRYRELCDMQFS